MYELLNENNTNFNLRVLELEKELGPYKQTTFDTDKSLLVYQPYLKLENGTVYSGQWDPKSCNKEGHGVQIWQDGSKYEGQWVNGKANGKGRFILADGDIYEGDWMDDKAHGIGTYKYSDGAIYNGEWVNDK